MAKSRDPDISSPLKNLRVGIGHDRHRLGASRPLSIGGVEIEHEVGLIGHSDADVLLHAVTDAILGALSEGDIGEWFPDTSDENKGRDSKEMLAIVLEKARGGRFRILNLDCTIHAQRPKFSPHKNRIRESIALLLGIDADRVSVKAKTGEKVGPVGRGESIDTDVVVLIEVFDE